MKARALLLACTFVLCRAGSLGAASPSLLLQVDGRSGTVVTDDPAPRLTWAPNVALPGLESWRVRVERTDTAGEKREWTIPAAAGPWRVIDGAALPSRARFRWRVEPGFARGAVAVAAGAEGNFEVGLKTAADWRAQWI